MLLTTINVVCSVNCSALLCVFWPYQLARVRDTSSIFFFYVIDKWANVEMQWNIMFLLIVLRWWCDDESFDGQSVDAVWIASWVSRDVTHTRRRTTVSCVMCGCVYYVLCAICLYATVRCAYMWHYTRMCKTVIRKSHHIKSLLC